MLLAACLSLHAALPRSSFPPAVLDGEITGGHTDCASARDCSMGHACLPGRDPTAKGVCHQGWKAYNGSQVQASWPEVAVHAPGARRARYVGGSGTPTLTFRYVVVEGDETDALDLTDGAGGWTPFRLDGGAWVRRASSEPTTSPSPSRWFSGPRL